MGDFRQILLILLNLPEIAGRFAYEFGHFQRWGFLWLLVALTSPFWARGKGKILALFLVMMIFIQIMALVFSPLEVRYQAASTVFRLVGQLGPLAAACVGIGLSRMTTLKTA